MTFVFYDTETTGTETWFDQILQFAAIRTDLQFNEIDRFEIRCRLLPHVVPAPEAMRTTRVRAAQLTDPALPSHYEMVCAIREKLASWSPSIMVGYNSLEFDEELLRQAFYTTLHPPYATNTGGNSRSDVIRMVHACHHLAPNTIVIPVGDKNQPVFKLDRVAPANGLQHANAHDALADVEATLHLSKLVAERAPDVWSAFMRFHKKASVVDYITAEALFCLCEVYFQKLYAYLVCVIGQRPERDNEWYVFDLCVDPGALAEMSDEKVAQLLKKGSPKPIRKFKANRVPIIFPSDEAPDCCKGKALGLDELMRRRNVLNDQPALRERLISLFESIQTEYPPSQYVEKQIYSGEFFCKDDEKLMESFHAAIWTDRLAIVEQFKDERLRTLGRRLIYIERPHLLGEEFRLEHRSAEAKRLIVPCEEMNCITLGEAMAEIEATLKECADEEREFWQQHHGFLSARSAEASKHLG